MTDKLRKLLTRDLATQRTIALYKDQEELIEKLSEEFGVNIKISKLVREGVDLVLKQLTEQLDKMEENRDN